MKGILAGLYIAKDVAMWCETLAEFKTRLDNKIVLTKELIEDGKNI